LVIAKRARCALGRSKYVLEGRGSSIRHCWLDIQSLDTLLIGYMRMRRHCSIDPERLVAYLDLEHTLDAWYRHTSPTNSGRPGTTLTRNRLLAVYAPSTPKMLCPIASVLGGRHTWLLMRRYVFLHLIQFPQGFETQDSEWTRSLFVRALGWSSRGLATDEIGESPKWREWEIWRALGG